VGSETSNYSWYTGPHSSEHVPPQAATFMLEIQVLRLLSNEKVQGHERFQMLGILYFVLLLNRIQHKSFLVIYKKRSGSFSKA
jgi:hypothetical protein